MCLGIPSAFVTVAGSRSLQPSSHRALGPGRRLLRSKFENRRMPRPLRISRWSQRGVHSDHRDGTMRVDGNAGSATSYEPNTKGEWIEQPDFREPPLALEGAADHWNHRADDDYYSQPGAHFG